jgi:flagellar basal body rod protein FlgB
MRRANANSSQFQRRNTDFPCEMMAKAGHAKKTKNLKLIFSLKQTEIASIVANEFMSQREAMSHRKNNRQS